MQVILRAAGVELGIGIDKEHLTTATFRFVGIQRLAGEIRTQHQDTGRDTGAVEQVLGQANDGLDKVLFKEFLTNLFLSLVSGKLRW
jgi:hypothetical protein